MHFPHTNSRIQGQKTCPFSMIMSQCWVSSTERVCNKWSSPFFVKEVGYFFCGKELILNHGKCDLESLFFFVVLGIESGP
jgi:hypothetical protein